jgi:uncharacterized protein
METLSVRETKDGLVFRIKVTPRSSRCEIAGVQDGVLKLKITAPPVEGKANEECIRYLSDAIGVKRNQVTIIGGHKSRIKTIAVKDMVVGELEEFLKKET